jgi:hypothetical protein
VTDAKSDLRQRLDGLIGKPVGSAKPTVSPPVMLQTWTMPPPQLEGIVERDGVPIVIEDSPLDELSADTVFEEISDDGAAQSVVLHQSRPAQ